MSQLIVGQNDPGRPAESVLTAAKVRELLEHLESQPNITPLELTEADSLIKPYGRPTRTGGLALFPNVRSRSAPYTVVFGEGMAHEKLSARHREIVENLDPTLEKVRRYVQAAPLVRLRRTIGANDDFNVGCTLLFSTQRPDNLRQGYLWAKTLRDFDPESPGPKLTILALPEWNEMDRQVLLFPEEGAVIILGSDYVGEVKMGFLRLAMWEAKQRGMLGLHAGSKVLYAKNTSGRRQRLGMLLFGLSGTGKSTHACHTHGLDGDGEGIEILQDDIVFLREDGAVLGTEQGFYLKTDGIEEKGQPIIYQALSAPGALLENVMTDYLGNVDFRNDILTSNGRAVVSRQSMRPYIAEDTIDLPSLEEQDRLIIAFITRRMTVLPIASKLSSEQAAATFMLGESIETSAGDPRRAGESVRVVGTNPFIIGDPAQEGNWFYRFLKSHEGKVECYLFNTGGVGEIAESTPEGRVIKQKGRRVAIEEMAAIIRGIARGTIQWERDPHFGTLVPARVDGIDMGEFAPERFYTPRQVAEYVKQLKDERKAWLAGFPKLEPAIVAAA